MTSVRLSKKKLAKKVIQEKTSVFFDSKLLVHSDASFCALKILFDPANLGPF